MNAEVAYRTAFGKAVHDARIARGWSQRRLTTEAGLSSHVVRDAELGVVCTTRRTAIQLADAFDFIGEERKTFLEIVPLSAMRGAGPATQRSTTQIGETVRRHRLAIGLSVSELAQGVGRSQSHITRLENGDQKTVAHSFVETLAFVLGLSTSDRNELLLLAGYAPDWAKDATVQQCASLLATLSPSLAQAWRRQIAAAWEKVQSRKKEA